MSNTFQNTTQAPAPKKKGSKVGIILAIVGVMLVGCCACCGGGAYYLYSFGTAALGEMVTKQFSDDPEVVKHLGGIESASFDVMATSAQEQEGNSGVLVFTVEGPLGEGELHVKQDPQQGDRFKSAVLKVGDEKIELDVN